MLAQPPYSFDLSVMYWAPTLALGGTLFALPSAITQDFKTTLCDDLFFRLLSGLQRHLLQIWPCCLEDFNAEKMPGITHFYFDGEELTVKRLKNCVSVSQMLASSMLTDQRKRL